MAARQTSNVVSINKGTKATPATASTKSSTGGRTRNNAKGSPPTGGDRHWRESVETRLGELRNDIRHLLLGGICLAVALIAAGWATYTSAMSQVKDLAVSQQNLAGKIDTMEAKLFGRLDLIEEKLKR